MIYDRTTIATLPWPATANGDYARRVLEPLVVEGATPFIANVDGEVRALVVGDAVLPVVLTNGATQIKNSYVCSPTTHYIDYACREVELELTDRPLLRAVFPRLLRSLRPLLHWAEFERVVYVNNWLLSTNLYPAFDQAALPLLRDKLIAAFPDRAIIFRSVCASLNADLGVRLAALGFRAVFSRQVYILDPRDGRFRQKKSFQKDRALARRTEYQWDEATIDDIPRLKQLYDDLYIDKYSAYNPQFSQRFFVEALRAGWLTLMVLRRNGRADGVLGFVERDGVMTTPLIGYDRSLPAEEGLYRLISLKLAEEAAARGNILHQSSGAAAFKRHRGSVPSTDYNYVYDHHLTPRRRLPWQLLESLTGSMIVPMMQRMGL